MARYNRLCLIEIAACVTGAFLLIVVGQARYIASWIALVVGAHFWPMSRLLRDASYIALGLALIVIALAGLGVALLTSAADSALVGAGSGTAMLIVALNEAAIAMRSTPDEHA
jgi:hypothetical protein